MSQCQKAKYKVSLANTMLRVTDFYKQGRKDAQAEEEPLTQEAIFAKLQSVADDTAIAQEFAQLLHEFYMIGYEGTCRPEEAGAAV